MKPAHNHWYKNFLFCKYKTTSILPNDRAYCPVFLFNIVRQKKSIMSRYIPILISFFILIVSGGCRTGSFKKEQHVIALQPLNHYSKSEIAFLEKELGLFFKKKIIVLPDRPIPDTFIDRSKGKRYSAGKIINWISSFKTDTTIAVIGLTHEDIFTTKKDKSGRIKQPASTYAIFGIFGLGYCPGPSCVVADIRLRTKDSKLFHHRLRTVTIHEIGHNMGLPHCPQKNCIMSDANEKISTVDNSGLDYCDTCRHKLNQ